MSQYSHMGIRCQWNVCCSLFENNETSCYLEPKKSEDEVDEGEGDAWESRHVDPLVGEHNHDRRGIVQDHVQLDRMLCAELPHRHLFFERFFSSNRKKTAERGGTIRIVDEDGFSRSDESDKSRKTKKRGKNVTDLWNRTEFQWRR